MRTGKTSASRRNRLVSILRRVTSDDGFSSDAAGYEEMDQRWMAREEASDGEQIRAAALGATITARFHAELDDLTAAISTGDRLAYEGTTYEVTGTKEIGRREGVEITTKAVDA